MKTTNQILTVIALLALSGSIVNTRAAEAVPGSISYQGRVTADGTNFTGAGQFKFALVGPGTVNLSRTATARANLVAGQVQSITVLNGGWGYVSAPMVIIQDLAPGQHGSGATATAQVSGGVVTGISVVTPGANYSSATTVTLTAPPASYGVDTLWSNDGTSSGGSEPASAVPVPVAGGLFTVLLGDTTVSNMVPIPVDVFSHGDVRLRLWFSDGAGPLTLLAPDQRVVSVGYALRAATADNANTANSANTAATANTANTATTALTANVANGVASSAVTGAGIANGTITSDKIASAQVVKSLNGLKDDVALVAGANVTFSTNANTLQIASASGWSLTGNSGTTPGVNFLGTTDNWPLELKVNGERGLRLEPGGSNSVNVIGGWSGNSVLAGVAGATIGGGGVGDWYGHAYSNRVDADFGTVSGGHGNTIQTYAWNSTIGGGARNLIQTAAEYSTIGGGSANTIETADDGATIGGGIQNRIELAADYSTIGGGTRNSIQTDADAATIGGGVANWIQKYAYDAIIGGGHGNTIEFNSHAATIGGGVANWIQISASWPTIGGGVGNTISPYAQGATIGGGYNNTIQTNAWYATIPGGYYNSATNYAFAAGSGAQANHTGAFVWADWSFANDFYPDEFPSITTNEFAVRAHGGVRLETYGAGLWVDGTRMVPGGGGGTPGPNTVNSSTIVDGSITSVDIADGTLTTADVQANTFWQSTGNAGTTAGTHFLGTTDNRPLELKVNGQHGLRLEPTADSPNLIGGWNKNYVATGVWGATIAGGGGLGYSNTVRGNFSSVGGGGNNLQGGSYATIGGGFGNQVADGAYAATIPGGISNLVSHNMAFAAGRRARAVHEGAFVWGDSTDADFESTTSDQFLVRARGGVHLVTYGAGLMVDTVPIYIGGVLANNLVTGASIVDGAIATADLANSAVTSAKVADGSLLPADLNLASFANVFWNPTGNVASAGQFLGTVNNQPLEFKVNGTRALRLEIPAIIASSPNVIGGYPANFVASGVRGATIAGGGGVSAGLAGWSNVITADFSSIGGGHSNVVLGAESTVGGGTRNVIQASGICAAIPGGFLNTAGGLFSFAAGYRAKATNDGSFVWGDSSDADITSTNANSWTARAAGGVRFFANSAATVGVYLPPGGNAWSQMSDRNVKENFQPVDARAVLDKLCQLPVTEWNLISQPASVRHVGPMAQDFRAAFGLGEDDRHISTSDADGVALVAIQGLNQKLEVRSQESEVRSQRLEAKNAALEKEVAELKALVKTLAAKVNGGGQ